MPEYRVTPSFRVYLWTRFWFSYLFGWYVSVLGYRLYVSGSWIVGHPRWSFGLAVFFLFDGIYTLLYSIVAYFIIKHAKQHV